MIILVEWNLGIRYKKKYDILIKLQSGKIIMNELWEKYIIDGKNSYLNNNNKNMIQSDLGYKWLFY